MRVLLLFVLLFLHHVMCLDRLKASRAGGAMCMKRGLPLEPICFSFHTLRTTIHDYQCIIGDPQNAVRASNIPGLTLLNLPSISDPDLLSRRGIRTAVKSFVGGYKCAVGWTLVGTKCYSKIENGVTFAEAKTKAQGLGDDVSLPIFHSDEDVKDVLWLLFKEYNLQLNSVPYLWSGSFYENGNAWKNLDGSVADYFRWAGPPQGITGAQAQVFLPNTFSSRAGSYLGYFLSEAQTAQHSAIFVKPAEHENQPPVTTDPIAIADDSCPEESTACLSKRKIGCLTIPIFYAYSAIQNLYFYDTDMAEVTSFSVMYSSKLPEEEHKSPMGKDGINGLPYILPPDISVNVKDYFRRLEFPWFKECQGIARLYAYQSLLPRIATQLTTESQPTYNFPGEDAFPTKKSLGYCAVENCKITHEGPGEQTTRAIDNERKGQATVYICGCARWKKFPGVNDDKIWGVCGATVPLYGVDYKAYSKTNMGSFYSTNKEYIDIAAQTDGYDKTSVRIVCYTWPAKPQY